MHELNKRITFGGEVVPAYLASAPKIIRAKRKMTSTPIPGSNREIVEMDYAWEPYDQPFSLFVGDGSENSIQSVLVDVARVLYKEGWQVLQDDYEPDYYRLAYYEGPFDVENRKTRVGVFTITFKCRAERFLISGNIEVDVPSGNNIFNPTAFKAKPLIHIEGSGNGTVTVNGTTMTFTNIADYLNVDCEKEDVYRLPAENRNNNMSGNFPVLDSGYNLVTFTGGITAVKITPRWWTL